MELRAVSYILSHVVEWGILALIILFQPEIRQILERLGSKNIRLMRVFRPEKEITEMEKAIDELKAGHEENAAAIDDLATNMKEA